MTAIITDRQERTRFLKFMVVGTIGAIVDFGILNLLKITFNSHGVDLGTCRPGAAGR